MILHVDRLRKTNDTELVPNFATEHKQRLSRNNNCVSIVCKCMNDYDSA